MLDAGEQPRSSGDVRLTYAELGKRLGISADAARVLARRREWSRVRPNRPGAPTLVLVSEEELAGELWRQDRTPPDDQADPPEHRVDDRANRAEQRADAAEQRADRAERRADDALALADRTLAQLADAHARADRAESVLVRERQRADEAQRAAQRALQTVETLRQADAARKARGLPARLWIAWRGR